jgi:hypothetical protein
MVASSTLAGNSRNDLPKEDKNSLRQRLTTNTMQRIQRMHQLINKMDAVDDSDMEEVLVLAIMAGVFSFSDSSTTTSSSDDSDSSSSSRTNTEEKAGMFNRFVDYLERDSDDDDDSDDSGSIRAEEPPLKKQHCVVAYEPLCKNLFNDYNDEYEADYEENADDEEEDDDDDDDDE